ncbi:hypothetical protein ScPMuIL_008255 [Solemya velum]
MYSLLEFRTVVILFAEKYSVSDKDLTMISQRFYQPVDNFQSPLPSRLNFDGSPLALSSVSTAKRATAPRDHIGLRVSFLVGEASPKHDGPVVEEADGYRFDPSTALGPLPVLREDGCSETKLGRSSLSPVASASTSPSDSISSSGSRSHCSITISSLPIQNSPITSGGGLNNVGSSPSETCSNSPNDGDDRKNTRTKYKPSQINRLERLFHENQYPDSDVVEKLATELEVTEGRIRVWFQNKRARWRRRSQSNMLPQTFPPVGSNPATASTYMYPMLQPMTPPAHVFPSYPIAFPPTAVTTAARTPKLTETLQSMAPTTHAHLPHSSTSVQKQMPLPYPAMPSLYSHIPHYTPYTPYVYNGYLPYY